MDVYLPKNRSKQTPFLILIHGGGWVAGDKSDMNALQDSLLSRGIASASMSYRYVSGSLHYEALMQDIAKALAFCSEHGKDWQTRTSHFIIGGMSAGAHMSLLYAYHYDVTNKIAGVISAAGPTDLSNTDYLNYTAVIGLLDEVEKMVGATYIPGQPLDARFWTSSPRAHMRNVPTLLLHGDHDAIVPYAQATELAADLADADYPHKLVTFAGANHDLGLANPTYYQLLLSEIIDWCLTYGN